jgi:hypothetical protein
MRSLLLSVLLVLFSQSAGAQAPVVTPRGLLPGDATVAAAAGAQQDHALARGGDAYLVVWSDYRGQAVGGGTNQSGGDIFGIRVDAAGQALDAAPFMVAGGMGLQDRPKVAWNGEAWLVLYHSQEPVDGYFGTRVQAVRVSAAGQVLDTTPLTLPAGTFTPDTIGLQLSGQAGQWLVTRCLYHEDGYGTYLSGQRIGANGQFLDAAPVMLMDWVYGQTVTVVGPGEYLVAGPEWNDSATTKARRIATTGQPVGASFTVPSLDIAGNGSEYYVTWLADFVNLVGSRLSAGGTLLTPAGTVLVPGYSQYLDQALAHDGSNWWLIWGAADQWRSLRVSAAGALLDPAAGSALPITVGGTINQAYAPQLVARPGGGVLMAWYDLRTALGVDANVFILPLSAANVPGVERCVSTGTRNQREPDLAEGPAGRVAVVFVSEHANDDHVLLHLLGADGQALAAEPIEVASAPVIGQARIAWNGSQFLVTWDQGASGSTPTLVKARRLAADGSFVDAVPFDVMTGFDPDVEALSGDFLVAAARYDTNPQFIYTWMRIVDGGTGAFRNAPTELGGGYVSVGPRVRNDGSRWVVTYHSHWSHNNAASDAIYNFVSSDGSFTPALNPATTSGGSGTPDVAFSGSAYLFVWRNNTLANANNTIAGRLMDAGGTFLTGNFTIAEAAGRQLNPTVGWDGTDFVVVWEDQRNQEAFFDERTDIYAARVTPAGVVRDPSGFVIHAGAQGDAAAAVLSRTNGVSHVAWTGFETAGTPLDTYRVRHAVIGELSTYVAGIALPTAPVALRQNVPNPFNPSTVISFTLARGESVNLAIYDLRGRVVRRLVDGGALPAGSHDVAWDGRGDDGRSVAAGVYLYSLRTPTLEETRRLTLAK